MSSANNSEWKEFISDGDKYFKAAKNGSEKRKKVFTPDIVYNMVSMGIEKHIMGLLLYHNQLPDNHTLYDLVDAVKKFSGFGKGLGDRMIRMDRFQDICSLSEYFRDSPEEKDVPEFLGVGQDVRDFVAAELPIPTTIAGRG